jgi:hypothetical protein
MRPITPRKRSLEFEIPSPHGQDILEFWTHETVLGLEVGSCFGITVHLAQHACVGR